MAEREVVTEKQLAGMLKIHPVTLWRMRRDGVAPKHFRAGRRILYRRGDIEAWMEEQMVKTDG
jgi:predicted DNA-binding transcriptional regulator AlpA